MKALEVIPEKRAENGEGPFPGNQAPGPALENQVRSGAESSSNELLQSVCQRNDAMDNAMAQRMNLVTTELQAAVMKTRLQPIRNLWDKFPRLVRDLARRGGKEADLVMEGADTELDRTLLEAIKEPLTDIVRNAVEQGIEAPEVRKEKGKPAKGTLFLKAFHEGGEISIEIRDDGGGMALEKVKSAEDGMTNVSGCGAWMDVLRTNIEKIGGTVDISSRTGMGTTFRIKIPLTLAIIPALMVKTGGELFAIPQASILELVCLEEEAGARIEMIHDAEFFRLRGMLLPLLHLKQVFRLSGENGSHCGENVVVLGAGKESFGLLVDEVIDSEEIVVKSLGQPLKGLTVFAGATILGDGKVALILDVAGIAREEGLFRAGREERVLPAQEELPGLADGKRQSLLLVNVSGHNRFAIPLSRVDRLEEFEASRIEQIIGGEVVQYCGGLLPLIGLDGILGEATPPKRDGTVPVVVFSDDPKSVGLVVEEILDIVEESVTIHRAAAGKPGIHGSAVVQGKTVDLLDPSKIIEMALSEGWHGAIRNPQINTIKGESNGR
ncbi:MAG: chemotaxis protein CheW [Nitrospirae bacterium]|nr:chemotaxis protein CheW [Nitrospirota bacterium]